METTAASDATDGPVMSVINKRLRAHRKKLNRILQMEEALSQGKSLNKEQEEVLRSKPYFVAAIDELEKLRPQLSSAVQEELQLFSTKAVSTAEKPKPSEGGDDAVGVGDLLNLLYFGSMFAVSSQSDYTSTMLRRTHERGCCLTYDYVTDDDSADLLGEKDLDLISMLSGLLISRPADSSFSHQNALQQCIEHAKLWLANSDQPIDPNSPVTYAALRERLNRIMASDYFTAMPEMKAPVEVAAAASAGNYAPVQVPVQGLEEPVTIPPQMEGSVAEQHGDKDEMAVEFQKTKPFAKTLRSPQINKKLSTHSSKKWNLIKERESRRITNMPLEGTTRAGEVAEGEAGAAVAEVAATILMVVAVELGEEAVGPTKMVHTTISLAIITRGTTITTIGDEEAAVVARKRCMRGCSILIAEVGGCNNQFGV
ncbi:hypothetical protein CRG98_038309 [Punica granatum]|uniref:Uncharacterized protein n=1 Tax=Punica granatum TaxID=22663 RepID=A0A2I0IBB8_PUNGR|nr:hypothetical protein CRG98_038309 [Punica granatum]